MKRFLVTLLAAVTAGGAFAQSSFPDVPDNHWAGGAVDRIADLGIVIGFPDGTFRGNEAFTRYQAALVVSRMLDVIGAELDARQALTDADLAALANALQDLAGQVAAHDDAIAAISDDVAVNSARLDALEAGLDTAQLQDLQNQIDALRVAVDTASAQAEAAHDLATNALGAANAAASRAAQNADALAALSWFANDLEGRVKALEERPLGDASLASRLAAAESDIANIREFVILIRREQVAMRGQVAALEEQVDANTGDIADLQERVAALEENMITFDGSISVNYRVNRMSGDGNDFDVDRAYGFGLGRSMGDGSVFSTGVGTTTNTPVRSERPREHRRDIGSRFNQAVDASLSLNVTFGRVFDGSGSPSALNDFEAVVDIRLKRAYNLDENAGGTDTFDGYVFSVHEFTGTFSPIGDAPLTFTFGEEVDVSFTPYVLTLEEVPGFVATLANPLEFLDFLDPTLTFAYVAPDSLDEVYRGVRLTVSPFDNVTIGASFAQHAVNTIDHDDLAQDNSETTVFGVDAAAAIGIFVLEGEFASSSTNGTDNGSLVYVTAGVDDADDTLPVIDSITANYRSIPAGWLGYGLNNEDDQFPFDADQTGFGVDASLSLWILDLEAYFDSYTTSVQNAANTADAGVTAFGVELEAELFRAFSLYGFFDSLSVDGTAADSTANPYDENDNALTAGAASVRRDSNNHRTGFGVGIRHDGEADNALVAGLDLDASYSQVEADFGRRVIEANASYELSLGFLSVDPYVGFTSESSANAATRPYDDYNVSEIRAGLSLETEEFDFFLRPSLVGVVNYRSASYTDNGGVELGGAAGDFTANEFQFSVGVTLNEFLFDNSDLTVRYASWAGTNVNASIGGGNHSQVSQIHLTDTNNGLDQYVNGWEAVWNYSDLRLAYGVYVSDEGPGRNSAGQVFSISYKVDF